MSLPTHQPTQPHPRTMTLGDILRLHGINDAGDFRATADLQRLFATPIRLVKRPQGKAGTEPVVPLQFLGMRTVRVKNRTNTGRLTSRAEAPAHKATERDELALVVIENTAA